MRIYPPYSKPGKRNRTFGTILRAEDPARGDTQFFWRVINYVKCIIK